MLRSHKTWTAALAVGLLALVASAGDPLLPTDTRVHVPLGHECQMRFAGGELGTLGFATAPHFHSYFLHDDGTWIGRLDFNAPGPLTGAPPIGLFVKGTWSVLDPELGSQVLVPSPESFARIAGALEDAIRGQAAADVGQPALFVRRLAIGYVIGAILVTPADASDPCEAVDVAMHFRFAGKADVLIDLPGEVDPTVGAPAFPFYGVMNCTPLTQILAD
jgi:hypothetical protein